MYKSARSPSSNILCPNQLNFGTEADMVGLTFAIRQLRLTGVLATLAGMTMIHHNFYHAIVAK